MDSATCTSRTGSSLMRLSFVLALQLLLVRSDSNSSAPAAPSGENYTVCPFMLLPLVEDAPCSAILWRHIVKAGGTTMRNAFERLSMHSGARFVNVGRQDRVALYPKPCMPYGVKWRSHALHAWLECARAPSVVASASRLQMALEYHVPDDGTRFWAFHLLETRRSARLAGGSGSQPPQPASSRMLSAIPGPTPPRARVVTVTMLRNAISMYRSEFENPADPNPLVTQRGLSWTEYLSRIGPNKQCFELALNSGFDRLSKHVAEEPSLRDDANAMIRQILGDETKSLRDLPLIPHICARFKSRSANPLEYVLKAARGLLTTAPPATASGPGAANAAALIKAEVELASASAALVEPLPPLQERGLNGILSLFTVVGTTARMSETLLCVCAAAGLRECPVFPPREHLPPVRPMYGRRPVYSQYALLLAANLTQVDRRLFLLAGERLDAQLARLPSAYVSRAQAAREQRCSMSYRITRFAKIAKYGALDYPPHPLFATPPAAPGGDGGSAGKRTHFRALWQLRQRAHHRALKLDIPLTLSRPLPYPTALSRADLTTAAGRAAVVHQLGLPILREGCCLHSVTALLADGTPSSDRMSLKMKFTQGDSATIHALTEWTRRECHPATTMG
jgi:hypothetical protein